MANVFMQEHAFQNYKDCFALPILAQAMPKIAIVLAACFALPCKITRMLLSCTYYNLMLLKKN